MEVPHKVGARSLEQQEHLFWHSQDKAAVLSLQLVLHELLPGTDKAPQSEQHHLHKQPKTSDVSIPVICQM